jgi:hypothetical protein
MTAAEKYKDLMGKTYEHIEFEVLSFNTKDRKTIVEIYHKYFEETSNNDYIPSLFLMLDHKTGKAEYESRTNFYDNEIENIKKEFEKIFKLEMIKKTFIN